jgi:uncharacterized membrane protein YeaQ/YmgE (transglycosylase-associated protein family)
MLENLFNLIKEQGSNDVINNPAIPNEQNNAVLASATHSIAQEFQGVLAGGGLQNIISLFGGGGNNTGGNGLSGLMNNPIVGNIISSFTNKLTNQHGIPADQASGIAGNLIPNVLSNLINKTNDSNDSSFNINGIINSLTGNSSNAGGGFDLQGMIGKFAGGSMDANGDGHVGLDDIISKVTNGARQQQTQTAGGGGLMDMIKGFMK